MRTTTEELGWVISLASAHDGYATSLSVAGRFEDAVAESQRAKELDPLSLGSATRMGLTLLFARRHDEAIQALKQVLATDPHSAHVPKPVIL